MAKKPKRKRTYEEIEVENRYLRKSRRASGIWSTLTTAIRWGGLSIISYFGWQAAAVLAGRLTVASVDVKADVSLGEKAATDWLPFIICAAGLLYGFAQSKLRKWTNARLTARITELEKVIDPARSTSSLTPYGDTREGDE